MSVNLGNTNIGPIYLGTTEITKAYLGTVLVYQKLKTEEALTLYQGYPKQNSSSYDGDEGVVSTSPIDITNLKSLTVTITQSSDDSVYLFFMNEYDSNKLFAGDEYIGSSMSLKTYTLSESDLNNYRTLYPYLGFTINSNTYHTLYPSVLTVTAYYTYY